MAIEGPLRELGIHDVFQLLDLSRKTGTLHVRSTLRDNEGTMFFGSGRVIYASIRSNPHPLGELLLRTGKVSEADLERALTMQRESHGSKRLGDVLVEIGAISQREIERQMKFQVEEVVFELLSWNEGFFSFEEGSVDELLPEATVSISTESLLMEGARRIDEWSRIATRISDLSLVPMLADIQEERPPQLDLLPNEWEVLSMVDSSRSVKQMAHALGRSDFEVARVLYGLVCTGVVEIPRESPLPMDGDDSVTGSDPAGGGAAGIIMNKGDTQQLIARARARSREGRASDAVQDLRILLQQAPAVPAIHLELGFAQAKAGQLNDAVESWRRYLELESNGGPGDAVRAALRSAGNLSAALQEHYHG
jgi:hypothetical protein